MGYYTSYYIKAPKDKILATKKIKNDLENLNYDVKEYQDKSYYYLAIEQVNDYTDTLHNYLNNLFDNDEEELYEDIGALRVGEDLGDYDYYGDYFSVDLYLVHSVEGFYQE
jgi:hypothetical protein